jgi:hypothetical protein
VYKETVVAGRMPIYIAEAAENPELEDALEFAAPVPSQPGTQGD